MQHVQETNLAWSLIDAAKSHLEARERIHVFVSVGSGDSFTAVRILLKLVAVKQIFLEPDLVRLCSTWLEAYALHEDHERLRILIEEALPQGPDRRLLQKEQIRCGSLCSRRTEFERATPNYIDRCR
ncbi:hypothetical protein FZI93_30320 [Mycobacterium sp. CBMA361]|nr:hypothetical protein [Mycolicibacterium sp. CBMA 361]